MGLINNINIYHYHILLKQGSLIFIIYFQSLKYNALLLKNLLWKLIFPQYVIKNEKIKLADPSSCQIFKIGKIYIKALYKQNLSVHDYS